MENDNGTKVIKMVDKLKSSFEAKVNVSHETKNSEKANKLMKSAESKANQLSVKLYITSSTTKSQQPYLK